MKKLIIILAAIFGMTIAASAAGVSSYTCDDSAIDALIESAMESNATATAMAEAGSGISKIGTSTNPVLAVVFNLFLGEIGIHRHYLGTSRFMWAAYLFTFGGIFGIVPLIDLIMEIVDLVDGGDLQAYQNNTRFFMWL